MAIACVAMLVGCTVLPVDQAAAIRKRGGATFDLSDYLAHLPPAVVSGKLSARAVPIDRLRGPDFASLADSAGQRAGEGSAPTFAVSGEGIVRELASGPRGLILIETASGPVTLQTGPVVSGTVIRDAIPDIDFDAFPDQISFAEVGMALTDRSLAALRTTIAAVKPGDRLRFVGAASVATSGEAVTVTPVTLTREARL